MNRRRANVFRLLPCAICGRQYGRTIEEQVAGMCCGQPQSRVLLQFNQKLEEDADTPHVVEAKP